MKSTNEMLQKPSRSSSSKHKYSKHPADEDTEVKTLKRPAKQQFEELGFDDEDDYEQFKRFIR